MASEYRGINPEARRTSGQYNSPLIDVINEGFSFKSHLYSGDRYYILNYILNLVQGMKQKFIILLAYY